VKIGAFITSLYDFDLQDNSFMCDFWFWTLSKNDELDFENTMEIPFSKEYSFDSATNDSVSDGFWFTSKAKAKIKKNWDVKAYPFDVQHIDIYIESTEYDTSSMIFVCDLKNSKIDPLLDFQEWIINSTKFSIEDRIYQTTFGNPDLDGESTYPAFKMSLTLVRKDSTLILFKLITGVLVAFIISCSVFFINPMHTDPRFGLCVGGLFAAVGNKYIVEGIVPSSNVVSMLDNIHNITFVYILIIILLSIFSLKLREKETEKSTKSSKKLDKISLRFVFVTYTIIITTLILTSIY
jgi:hypothetical protein